METPLLPLLSDLERWLALRENAVPGLKPGVAAGIVWADPNHRQRTPVAVIYLHGYTASRGEIFPVPDRVAQALGANLFYARLTGHGAGAQAHRDVRVEDWVKDGLEALQIGRSLGERVVVMATSTGAALTAWLIQGPSQSDVAATVLISPNLTPKDRKSELLLWPGKEWILRTLVGSTVGWKPENDLGARYWDWTHHSHSLIPMMQLVRMARGLDFRKWRVPTLVVYDRDDSVVDARVSQKLFSKAPKDLVRLLEWKTAPGDHHHVLAGDALSPQGTDKMVESAVGFLRPILAPPRVS